MDNIDFHDRVSEGYYGLLGEETGKKIRKRVNWIASSARGESVLDVGCSQGITSILLAREGKSVTGIDIEAAAIDYASNMLNEEDSSTSNNLRLVLGNFMTTSELDDSYDTIIITEVLEHLINPIGFLKTAEKYLQDDGRLIVSVPFGINDFIDHKRSYSFNNIVKDLEKYFEIVEYNIMGKWIGFVCNKATESSTSLLNDDSYLEQVEKNILDIEREAIERHTRAKNNYLNSKKRETELKEKITKTLEIVKAKDTSIGKLKHELKSTQEQLANNTEAYEKTLLDKVLEHEVLEKRLNELNTSQVNSLTEELKSMESKLIFTETLLSDSAVNLLKSKNDLLEVQETLSGVRKSVKYKLGTLILTSMKPGKNMLLFPVNIIKLIRYGIQKRKSDKTSSILLGISTSKSNFKPEFDTVKYKDISNETLLDLFNTGSTYNDKYGIGRELIIRYKNIGNIRESVKILKIMIGLYPDQVFLKRELKMRLDLDRAMNDKEFSNIVKVSAKSINHVGKVLNVLNVSAPYSSNGYSIRSKNVVNCQKEIAINPVVVTRPGFPSDFNHEIHQRRLQREIVDDISYYRINQDVFYRHTPLYEYLDIYVDRLIEIIKIEKPDVVHSASNYVNGLAGLRAAKQMNLPFIYEVRGFWELTTVSKTPEFEDSEEYQMSQKIETYLAIQADRVVVICEGLKNELILRGIPEDKIYLCPNGVDADHFTITKTNAPLEQTLGLEGKYVIGYIGSLVKYEGIQTVIKALGYLLENQILKNTKYVIVGDGDYIESLKELVHNRGLDNVVIFTGRIPHDQVLNYYSLFDLCIYPREANKVTNMVTPLKPLEAMSCNIPVIGSDTVAMREIIKDGLNGSIFTDENQLIELLKEHIDGRGINEDFRSWVLENRTWEIIQTQYADIYK